MGKAATYKDYLSTENNIKLYLILFLIWPFLAFLLAIKNYYSKEAKRVVYLYLIYYGLTFVVGELGGAGSDSERYALGFKQLANSTSIRFKDLFIDLYVSDGSVDIFEKIIRYILSRFTSYSGVLFAAYAAIFGFFYLKSINLLYNRYKERPEDNTLIFLIFFIMILPISAINGFRMWTAAWIFFYSAYHVILFRKTKYLLLALSSSLVHFSFFSANAILLIYYIAGNRNIVYLPLTISSFILPGIALPFFRSFFGSISGGIQRRANMYSSESSILGRQELFDDTAWFMKISNNLLLYYLFLTILYIQIRRKDVMQEPSEKNLYSFILLFLAFVNFGKSIPSFGDRFQVLFFIFATVYIFIYITKIQSKRLDLITLAGLFPMALYSAISFRQLCDGFNVFVLTPGFGLPLLVPGISLADLLFQ